MPSIADYLRAILPGVAFSKSDMWDMPIEIMQIKVHSQFWVQIFSIVGQPQGVQAVNQLVILNWSATAVFVCTPLHYCNLFQKPATYALDAQVISHLHSCMERRVLSWQGCAQASLLHDCSENFTWQSSLSIHGDAVLTMWRLYCCRESFCGLSHQVCNEQSGAKKADLWLLQQMNLK